MICLCRLDRVQMMRQGHHEQVSTATDLPVVVHVGDVARHLRTDSSASRDGVSVSIQGGDVSLDTIPDSSCSDTASERTAGYQIISRFGETKNMVDNFIRFIRFLIS